VRGKAKKRKMNKNMPNFRVDSNSRHTKVITVKVMNSMEKLRIRL